MLVTTSPATLAEAIHTAHIQYNQTLTPADLQTPGQTSSGRTHKLAAPKKLDDEFLIDFKDIVLYDHDGDLGTIYDQLRGNGEIQLRPTIDFDLVIQNFKLQELNFTIEVENTTKLEVEAGVDLLDFDKSVEVARFPLKPIIVWAGHVPIVLTPIITIDVGVDGNVSIGINCADDRANDDRRCGI